MTEGLDNRRPLKSRQTGWAAAIAGALGRARISPDLISLFSVVFAVVGGAALLMSGPAEGAARVLWLLLAALCIQLRLLANLFDGMVAVEHGLGGPAGPIWNELPDRFADVFFLAGAGYGAVSAGLDGGAWIGWLASVLAVLTAYVRELGRGLGFPADFSGPMAKPHRMFVLTAACVISAFEPLWNGKGQVLLIALGVIAAGGLVTVGRRTARIARLLRDEREKS